MLTDADYIRQQISINDREIADAEIERQRRKESLDKVDTHLDNLHVRRMRLAGELERATAPNAQRQGRCHVVKDGRGVAWDV